MKKNFLDAIDVKTPCDESWEEMTGNNEVRFCSHCAKNVHNISAMTRTKAEKLVKDSNGQICVRYVKNPQGKIVNLPPKLTQIKRRAALAAGVLAASLTLSTQAYSQGEPLLKVKTTQTQKDNSLNSTEKQKFSRVFGEIKDEAEGLIPKAKITLRNTSTGKIRETSSNDDGFYEFKDVEPAIYELTAESLGFAMLKLTKIEVLKDADLNENLTLTAGEATVGIFIIADDLEALPDIKPAENIQQQTLLELPVNDRNIRAMGLMSLPQTETKPTKKNAKSKKKKKKT
ncbi:MAG TPA: carboxypeptidase-like regulatory domain-containing protein [Pyrinomonadaceae bacterium]|nr:carboxypeptidase-like regulatory domain-containing protein [Pyrinomonadaceae bacterium]